MNDEKLLQQLDTNYRLGGLEDCLDLLRHGGLGKLLMMCELQTHTPHEESNSHGKDPAPSNLKPISNDELWDRLRRGDDRIPWHRHLLHEIHADVEAAMKVWRAAEKYHGIVDEPHEWTLDKRADQE